MNDLEMNGLETGPGIFDRFHLGLLKRVGLIEIDISRMCALWTGQEDVIMFHHLH